MAVRRERGCASALLVSAPFYHQHRPAPGFHAALESPLADALRAAMGTGLRARGSLLGRRGAAGDGEQWRGQHADEGGCNDKSCHDFVSPRGAVRQQILRRDCEADQWPAAGSAVSMPSFLRVQIGRRPRGDLNFTIASDLGRNVTRDRFRAPTVAEGARIALSYRITIRQNRGDTSAHAHESPGPTTAGASLFAPGDFQRRSKTTLAPLRSMPCVTISSASIRRSRSLPLWRRASLTGFGR